MLFLPKWVDVVDSPAYRGKKSITNFDGDMDLRQLEAFRAVIEAGSVTQAANALGVTQPAVSAQIARLESSLGFPLFERSGNRLRPTPEASAFRLDVEEALSRIDGLARAAAQLRDGEAGTLAVACHPMAGLGLMPAVISSFLSKRPEVKVQLLTRNSDVIRGMFPSRTLDLGVAAQPIDPSGLEVTRYRLRCVAILPKGHALARHRHISPDLLAGVPFIGMSREWSTYHVVTAAFADAGVKPVVVAESELFAIICSLVASGTGVSIVDPATAAHYAHIGLEIRPFIPEIHYEIAAFYSSEHGLSRIGRNFLIEFDNHLKSFT